MFALVFAYPEPFELSSVGKGRYSLVGINRIGPTCEEFSSYS